MSDFIEIDFEFRGTNKQRYDLVCCSTRDTLTDETNEFWLFQENPLIGEESARLQNYLNTVKDTHILLCWMAVAEARSILSLHMDPTKFKWVDGFVEFRCQSNHNHKLQYGKQLVNGKVKMTFPPKPKWERTEQDIGTSHKLKHSLVEAAYKYLGVFIDSELKDKIRDIIIHGTDEQIIQNKSAIIKYCTSDLKYLHQILKAQVKEYKRLYKNSISIDQLRKDMLERGRSMVDTAIMEFNGYPCDIDSAKNFAAQVPDIVRELQEDINSQFTEHKPFKWNKKENRYSQDTKAQRAWILNSGLSNRWLMTDTNQLSLALDAWGKNFSFAHDFPRNNYGAQVLRFLKFNQSVRSFTTAGGKDRRTFFDYENTDGMMRCNLNAYGSQAGRFQPGSTGFLFLKSAWMRSLCVPPPGYCIIGIDYKSEEFLIQGLLSGDVQMIKDYQTGDVYLAFAKSSKMVPKNATKKSHPLERQTAKSTVLGISYDMTEFGLCIKLTNDTGVPHSPEEALKYIDAFNETYHVNYNYKSEVQHRYSVLGYLRQPDGWTMFGDNDNFRSVGNFEPQGMGGVILRKAIRKAIENKLKVIMPLHDALYSMVKISDMESAIDLKAKLMKDAFKESFTGKARELADVFLDIEVWSPELTPGELVTAQGNKVKVEKVHIDERGEAAYHELKKYFTAPDWMLV